MLTEKEIIQKIQLIRAIEPNKDWASFLHAKLMEEASHSEKNRVSGVGFRLFKPFPTLAAAGTFSLAIIIFFGLAKVGNAPMPNPENESALFSSEDAQEFVIQGGGEGGIVEVAQVQADSRPSGEELSRGDANGGVGAVRTIKVGNGKNIEFEEELFDRTAEKLRKVEGMVFGISNASDARQAKDLLLQAKASLDEGNVVDAFEVLVALERLLNE